MYQRPVIHDSEAVARSVLRRMIANGEAGLGYTYMQADEVGWIIRYCPKGSSQTVTLMEWVD